MDIESLNQELAYYSQINKINKDTSLLDHFVGHIDKDMKKETAENLKLGDSKFSVLDLYVCLHHLINIKDAPDDAIKNIENFLDKIVYRKAENHVNSFRPNIELGMETAEHLTNMYKKLFGYEPTSEREEELKSILKEHSKQFELQYKPKEEGDLPF
jgi:hypothetical protein